MSHCLIVAAGKLPGRSSHWSVPAPGRIPLSGLAPDLKHRKLETSEKTERVALTLWKPSSIQTRTTTTQAVTKKGIIRTNLISDQWSSSFREGLYEDNNTNQYLNLDVNIYYLLLNSYTEKSAIHLLMIDEHLKISPLCIVYCATAVLSVSE